MRVQFCPEALSVQVPALMTVMRVTLRQFIIYIKCMQRVLEQLICPLRTRAMMIKLSFVTGFTVIVAW